ncbi:MAG: hypothetical protein H3C64_03020 [Candidatus Kuenenia stuttgartiensis]|nr:hypothetical protein [Candidatus Kuenenia stuttgartiensis]
MHNKIKILLIANIGSRDLQLEGEAIKPARIEGERMNENFKSVSEKLSTPILSPIINYLKDNNPDSDIELLLFSTNQEDAAEHYRSNDTLYFAKCIQQLYRGKKPITKVAIKEIDANPNLYDSMFEYFGKFLSGKKSMFDDHFDEIYVSLAGGIPACNMALCFHSISIFQQKCVPVYSLEGSGIVVPLQIGKQLIKNSKIALVLKQIENFEYSVASSLLRDLNQEDIASVAEITRHRLNFNFDLARSQSGKLIAKVSGKIRNLLIVFTSEFQELLDHDLKSLILELYFNAEIKWKKGEYLDFLGRLFRFQEAVLRYIVETNLEIVTDTDKNKNTYENYSRGIQNIEGLIPYLEQYPSENNKLLYNKPSVPTLMAILNFITQKNEGNTSFSNIFNTLRELQRLNTLRNKSPLGHVFEGVSKEKIEKIIPGFSLEQLVLVIENLDIKAIENPFIRVNKLIESLL